MLVNARRLVAGALAVPVAFIALTAPVPAYAAPEDDLLLGADAFGSATRTYDWVLSKSVDATTKQVREPSTQASFDWTVTATPDGTTDSEWGVSGQTGITNDGAGEFVTTFQVTYGGTECWTPSTTITVLSGYTPVPFSCQVSQLPNYDETATVTIGTRSWDVPVVWSFSEENKSVTVVDDKAVVGSTPVVLGAAEWNAEGTPTSFIYSQDFNGPTDWAGSTEYTNTASIAETSDQAQVKVTVTTPMEPTAEPTATPTAGPTASPTEAPVTSPTAMPTSQVSDGAAELAYTGTEAGGLGLLAGVLLLSGVVVLVVSRRRLQEK